MSKNLILSAAVGYNFVQIEFFIKSLRKFYQDNVCIIIDNKDNKLESQLKEYDCSVIKTKINKKDIQFKRYEIFSKYLEGKVFDKILSSKHIL